VDLVTRLLDGRARQFLTFLDVCVIRPQSAVGVMSLQPALVQGSLESVVWIFESPTPLPGGNVDV
jgi:hypothetical protein